MKKINIIKESKEFDKIIHTGNLLRSKYYILYYLNNNDDKYGASSNYTTSRDELVCNKIISSP